MCQFWKTVNLGPYSKKVVEGVLLREQITREDVFVLREILCLTEIYCRPVTLDTSFLTSIFLVR